MSERIAWERAFVRARHAHDTLAAALSERAARSIEAASHEPAIGETSVGDTRPLLVGPTDAFAARRMDDGDEAARWEEGS